jgi:hypothetical protein
LPLYEPACFAASYPDTPFGWFVALEWSAGRSAAVPPGVFAALAGAEGFTLFGAVRLYETREAALAALVDALRATA